ncbi:MAG: hypothetical protein JWN25_372 [Verrucomicrobiales bacterium]|nr:hypothetical protein [Verrucomicrobiales bacterium]
MKKLLCITLGLCFLGIADIHAAKSAKKTDAKKGVLTEEQKTTVKDLVAKYDTNKDGKMDKDEIKKMTSEDAAKYKSLMAVVKKADKKAAKAGDKTTETPAEKPADKTESPK